MRLFKRRDDKHEDSTTAVVDRPAIDAKDVVDHYPGTNEELAAEIERLTEAARTDRSHESDCRVLELRHILGIRRLNSNGAKAEFPPPDFDRLPEAETLPELSRDDLTPELLRAGILRDGCVLVRGLVDRDTALAFADQIDRSFVERMRLANGEPPEKGYYDEFKPKPPYSVDDGARMWVMEGGGVLAPDAPMLAFEMLEMYRSAGLPDLISGYLGEPAAISVQKTTLRKAEPSVPGAWHQDGAFMGDVRALNLWLSLSRCGDESPGLDIVPRRLDEIVATTTDEALLSYQVSQSKAEEAAGDKPIMRPIFEPGDALFFDEMFLHQTGSDPSMPKPRYAIESWFFGGSAFPGEYAPIAV
jgi:hypothetical protein